MIKLQQNRYLWVHFTGLAFVPLLLDICLAGLASAGPALPFGGQFWAIALLGITPALAMQWLKPFYIFSLPPSALKPSVLSEDQRRCLTIFKSWQIKALAVVVAFLSLWLLAQIYAMSPQISPVLTPKAGLLCGASAFFIASSFMQISVSAGRALLIGPTALKRVTAVEKSAIARDFLILGIRVNKLLPERLSDTIENATNEAPRSHSNQPIQTAKPSRQPSTADEEQTIEGTSTVEDDSKAISKKDRNETAAPHNEVETLDAPSEATQSATVVEIPTELEVIIPEKLPPEGSIDP